MTDRSSFRTYPEGPLPDLLDRYRGLFPADPLPDLTPQDPDHD